MVSLPDIWNQSWIENVVDNATLMRVNGKTVSYPGAITVYNLHGQVVATGKDVVGLQHLSRGIYVVQGRGGSHVETIKVAIGS